MAGLTLVLMCSVLTTALGASRVLYKREIPVHSKYADVDYHGYNGIEDYGHYPHFAHLHIPPAYSTISYVQSHHSKPVSYSGFTNHGRGHLDPGYAIEFRSEGFHHPHHFDSHYF